MVNPASAESFHDGPAGRALLLAEIPSTRTGKRAPGLLEARCPREAGMHHAVMGR